MNPQWIVWVDGSDGGFHYIHETLEMSKREAERLAVLPDIKGKRVFVAEIIASCKHNDVVWDVTDTVRQSDIPF